jgi:hypothetical protein
LAAALLLLVSVVILPVLPDQGYGPWQALNLYEIWWLVVLMAISFAAYCAVKIAGAEKGILLTGFLVVWFLRQPRPFISPRPARTLGAAAHSGSRRIGRVGTSCLCGCCSWQRSSTPVCFNR